MNPPTINPKTCKNGPYAILLTMIRVIKARRVAIQKKNICLM